MDIWVIRNIEATGRLTKVEGVDDDWFDDKIAQRWVDAGDESGYEYWYPGEWFRTYEEADKAARKKLDLMRKKHVRKGRELARITKAFYDQHKELTGQTGGS